MRIDQYLPGFAPHDAIGNHTLQARRILREAGFDSDIWAEHILPPLGREARPYTEDPCRPGEKRVLLYHSSTNSAMAAWLQARAEAGETLVSDYHNITPAQYFARWEPAIAQALIEARQELAMLAPHVDFSFADSGYNEAELVDCGYRQTLVCPLLVDLDEYHIPPDPGALDRLRRRRETSGTQWLFVGRVAPNKCQHDVVGAFAVYRRVFDPAARLTIVGGGTSVHYLRAPRISGRRAGTGRQCRVAQRAERRRAAGPLGRGGRVRLSLRARRLLCPDPRGDGTGGARGGLPGRRRSRDAR